MNLDLKIKSLLSPALLKDLKKFKRHIIFVVLIIVLLTYVVVVLKISTLSKAEPTPDQTAADSGTIIPHVNQQAINRIQSLEDHNTQIHSLFEQARNNPFQE